jgi:HSP20 family protein
MQTIEIATDHRPEERQANPNSNFKEDVMSGLTRWEPLTRWSPLKELEEMEKRLSTFFGRPMTPTAGDKEETMAVAQWSPLVDITEDEKEYVVKAEIPEMKKEDIKLNVHDDVLTITGERKYEKEEKGKKYHRVERAYGSFMRSFTLPDDADGSKISAEYKDGVLKVHLPKSEKAKPKAIEVKIA